ncbi:MAG TPA: hypothetical protein VK658_13150 [Chryseolinea sp.]|nr:hypothetical protein [Chryseolinea sp.]
MPPAPVSIFRIARRILMLVIVMTAFGGALHAQNTKGDQPSSPKRESRFKTPFKKKKSPARSASSRRVRTPQRSVATRANGGSPRRASGKERPGKPVRPISAPRPHDRQKAWTGDIAGYRLRHKNRSSAGDGKSNVYPQYGRYVRSKGARPKDNSGRAVSNAGTLAQLRRLESRGGPSPRKSPRIVPRSASRSFTARKSINVYANFARPKRTTKQYNNTDLAGRPLHKKNFESPRPTVSGHRPTPFYHGRPGGERPYKGPSGGYRSATRATPKAWTGDVAGRGLRRRNFTSKKSTEGIPTLGRHPRSASKGHPGDVPLMGRPPGMGAWGIDSYRGNTRGGKPAKGGGSVSGRRWNNNGMPIDVRMPVQGADAALFRGRIRGGKPATGGGSVSGRLWNNNQQPIQGRMPLQGARAAQFQGNVKAGRPERGMPNVANSMPRRGLSSQAKKVSGYPGKMKRFEVQPGFGYQGESHTGDVRLKRFRKNYVQHPDADKESIKKHRPKSSDAEGLTAKVKRPDYQRNKNTAEGALLKVRPSKADTEAGELQVRVKQGDYRKRPHAAEGSMLGLKPSRNAQRAEELTARTKQPDYGKRPHAAEGSMPGIKPSRNAQRATELTARVKQPDYGKKPHAAEGSMPGIKPSKNSVKASEYAGGVKRNWDYIHNPSSAQEALRTREPGKAYARAAAYQGNIKMQKFALFEKNRNLHPDTKFIKPNKNNVDSERDAVTNFKLWWARLFKKEETQPDNLKYKGKKPRYDKGEQGLWYD